MAENMKVFRLSKEVKFGKWEIFSLPIEATHVALGRGKMVIVKIANLKGNKRTNKWRYVEVLNHARFVTFSRYFSQSRSGFYYSSIVWKSDLDEKEKATSIDKDFARLEERRRLHAAKSKLLARA